VKLFFFNNLYLKFFYFQGSVPALRQPYAQLDQPVTPIVAQPERQSVIQFAPRITRPTPQGHIQIAPQIFVPDVPANTVSEDEGSFLEIH